ncbi:class II aldolase/adducin family protein [Bacillus sp. N9]
MNYGTSHSRLKKYAARLVDSGLVVGAGGNLSMRAGEYMYISPSGFDLKEIEDDQWVKVHIGTGK